MQNKGSSFTIYLWCKWANVFKESPWFLQEYVSSWSSSLKMSMHTFIDSIVKVWRSYYPYYSNYSISRLMTLPHQRFCRFDEIAAENSSQESKSSVERRTKAWLARTFHELSLPGILDTGILHCITFIFSVRLPHFFESQLIEVLNAGTLRKSLWH